MSTHEVQWFYPAASGTFCRGGNSEYIPTDEASGFRADGREVCFLHRYRDGRVGVLASGRITEVDASYARGEAGEGPLWSYLTWEDGACLHIRSGGVVTDVALRAMVAGAGYYAPNWMADIAKCLLGKQGKIALACFDGRIEEAAQLVGVESASLVWAASRALVEITDACYVACSAASIMQVVGRHLPFAKPLSVWEDGIHISFASPYAGAIVYRSGEKWFPNPMYIFRRIAAAYAAKAEDVTNTGPRLEDIPSRPQLGDLVPRDLSKVEARAAVMAALYEAVGGNRRISCSRRSVYLEMGQDWRPRLEYAGQNNLAGSTWRPLVRVSDHQRSDHRYAHGLSVGGGDVTYAEVAAFAKTAAEEAAS